MAAIDTLGEVCDRLTQGLMFHSDHASLHRLVGMRGFSRMHEHQFLCDSIAMRRVTDWAISHCGMLPPQGQQSKPKTLDPWMRVERTRIDAGNRRKAVSGSFDAWVDWESDTKATYQQAYDALMESGDVDAAAMVLDLVRDVSNELAEAEEMRLNLMVTSYDLPHMLELQDALAESCERKIAKVGKDLIG